MQRRGVLLVKNLPSLPFALSVRCPASETTEIPAAVFSLQEDLFRRRYCFVETCGWTSDFTVILVRDWMLWKICELLADAGCSVGSARALDFPYERSDHPILRSLTPWNNSADDCIAREQYDAWIKSQVASNMDPIPESPPDAEDIEILPFMRPAA